jgi:hypothetical protein
MNWTQAIPLDRAYLCADCEFVGADGRRCGKCGGGALYPLRKLLDRLPATPADAAVTRLEFETLEKVMRRR